MPRPLSAPLATRASEGGRLAPLGAAHKSRLPGALFASGIVLFSGSLYALVLTDRRAFGAITPLGGLALIGGWLALLL